MIGAGSLAVLGLTVLLFRGKAESNSQMFSEIDALGPVRKEANGELEFGYYKDIFMILSKTAKQRFQKEKQSLLTKRRQCLKEGKMVEYRDIVKEIGHKEEHLFEELVQVAAAHIGLSENDFLKVHSHYMSNPTYQHMLMQA